MSTNNNTSSMDTASPTTSLEATPSSSSNPTPAANSSPRIVSSSPSFRSSSVLPSTSTPPPASSTPPPSSSSSSSAIPLTSSTPQPVTPSTTPALIPSTIVLTIPGTPLGPQITTVTSTLPPSSGSNSASNTAASSTAEIDPTLQGSNNTSINTGLSQAGKTAIEVIVPIVGVSLIVLALVFFFRQRKQRKDAEELRKKEVEEYGYNPNDDPTLPAVGGVKGAVGGGPFEMREDGGGGYRGWGATATVGSSGRKASTTVSGGPAGMAFSEGQSPTHGPISDARSGDTLIGSPSGRPASDGSEVLGTMGPAAIANRGGDMHRGPSNASSSYSAANRSDGSGEQPVAGGAYGQAQYYAGEGNYGGPYADAAFGGAAGGRAEVGGKPIIRDNLARRATRIENPSHFPTQASAGISQNF